MKALDALLNRNSQPKLKAPYPKDEELDIAFKAALRAPDHVRLTPWRFIKVSGDARHDLGQLFVESLDKEGLIESESKREKLRLAPMRAPLVIVSVAKYIDHPKVPVVEQTLSAGAGVGAMLTAFYAMGYGAIWRTGAPAFSERVAKGLRLDADEIVTGYIYVGTPDAVEKPIPRYQVDDFVTVWE